MWVFIAGQCAAAPATDKIEINIADVERFYRVYDAAGGHPTAAQLQRDYLQTGSDGLHQFAALRKISGETIAAALARHPEIYADARRHVGILPSVRHRLEVALGELRRLYPDARLPTVTIAVGRGKPAAVGSPVHGVMVGLEALCAVRYFNPNMEDRFVHIIAHEFIHVQQVTALVDDEHPTVLEASLIEGAAEFLGELISGEVGYPGIRNANRGHEREIETAFLADVDQRELSKWLYNGTAEKQGDIGYWVGYRIVKAYYRQAADKHQAVHEIVEMNDPKAFLARSGWHPGIELD